MKNLSLSNRSKGVLFIIMSAFGFAMMSAFVKLSGDLPSFQKTFFRNITSCIIAFTLILVKKESFFGKLENQKILILRSVFGTLGIVFNFYAIDKLVLAFVGALFIIKPQFNFDIIPSLIGVCGAICAAAAYTCLRVLGSKEKYYTIVFYFSFFSTMVILPFMLMVYKEMTLAQLLYLILAGIFASVGQFGVTIAYKYAKAKEISIFDYSNIVFSALISFMLFGTLPDYLSVVGYIIIFTVSLYMFLYNKKLDKIDNK